jgi:hypothetical protein
MKFTKWVHPKTGEVRVYVNGVADQGQGFRCRWRDDRALRRWVSERHVVNVMGGSGRRSHLVPTFEDYVKMVG